MTQPARLAGIFGGSGTGKSAGIKRALPELLKRPPLLVFDPGAEYHVGAIVPGDESALYAMLNRGAELATFRPSHDAKLRARQFGRFCLAALALARARGRCCVIVDELHLMTDAGSAPAGWGELVMTGRKFGVSIVAASIRPAAIDKGFWTNCTLVRSGRLLYEDDQKTVARALGVEPAELAALKSPPGAQGCDYIERDMLTGETRRGRLIF